MLAGCYRFFKQSNLRTPKEQKKLVRGRQVINAILKQAITGGVLPEEGAERNISLDRNLSTRARDVGYGRVLDLIDVRRRISGQRVYEDRIACEIQFTTIYQDIVDLLAKEERTV
jgi:hypothetical protein